MGLAGAFFIMFLPKKWREAFGLVLFFLSLFLMICTFVPGLGHKAGGASRWLQLPFGFKLQPGEFLKIFMGFAVAYLFAPVDDTSGGSTKSKMKGKSFHSSVSGDLVPKKFKFLFACILLGSVGALYLLQPDFGSMVLVSFSLFVISFVYVKNIFISLSLMLSGALSFLVLVLIEPYRMRRLMGFINPWKDPYDSGFQMIQGLSAIREGGFFGKGLGQSLGKHFFLPEAHTDYTLAVLGEEVGFVGLLVVLGLFAFFFLKLFDILVKTQDQRSQMILIYMFSVLGFTALFNIGINFGLLPPKGLTLPFISYGGSSLLSFCLLMGFFLGAKKDLVATAGQRVRKRRVVQSKMRRALKKRQ